MRQRVVSFALTVAAAGYTWQARTFDADFIADPIGPNAFPLVIGALLLASCAWLAMGAGDGVLSWSRRQSAVVGALCVYVLVLRPLGFLVATTALVTILVMLFGGPWKRGLGFGFLVCAAIFVLFAYVLSVPLPIGLVFGGR